MVNRKKEVRELMNLTPEQVIQRAGDHLVVLDNLEELYKEFAKDMEIQILGDSKDSDDTRLILPVGPVEQYDYLVKNLKSSRRSLANCSFFFMDEYCDHQGKALTREHPLSFKRAGYSRLVEPLKKMGLKEENVTFPSEANITELASIIEKKGGIDACYGGIGIHGHVAFNEPEKGVSKSNPRMVNLNNYTITINSIRSQVGGNLENFPRRAFTLGMEQIWNAKRIRLCCRSDILDWASTILRIALFGTPGDDYPVTYLRDHPDYVIFTDKNTIKKPEYII